MKYKIKKTAGDKCRLVGCRTVARVRGICAACCQRLRAKGLYEKYATTDKMLETYKIKKIKNSKKCIVLGCSKKPRSRGICNMHYNRMLRRGVYEKYAL